MFFEFLKILLLYFLTFIFGLFFPKDENITICASSRGKYYNGNSRGLFEYMLSKKEQVYFFVSSRVLYKKLVGQNIRNVVYQYSLEGMLIFIKARTVCFTHGYADFLGFMPSPFQNWIYLGHGIGSKALGRLKEDISLRYWFELLLTKPFYYIITSDFDRYMFISMLDISPKKIFITGYPRNDILYQKEALAKSSLSKILYAPTYGRGPIKGLLPFSDFKLTLFDELLNEKGLEFYVRFHPNNYKISKDVIKTIFEKSNQIVDKSPDIVSDVQDLLPEVDILITDFSSISRDFLFLDRPMIFIMNGIDELGKLALPIRKEFAFCGYQVYTYKEFEQALEEILSGNDRYAEVRRFVRDLSYNYIDDKSSERVAQLIKELA